MWYRCYGKYHLSHTCYTPKYFVELYEKSLKNKEKIYKKNYFTYEDSDSNYDHILLSWYCWFFVELRGVWSPHWWCSMFFIKEISNIFLYIMFSKFFSSSFSYKKRMLALELIIKIFVLLLTTCIILKSITYFGNVRN